MVLDVKLTQKKKESLMFKSIQFTVLILGLFAFSALQAASPHVGEVVILKMKERDITHDKKRKRVVYTPNSGRKQSYYDHYIFNRKQWKHKIGFNRRGNIKISVKIMRKVNRQEDSEFGGAQPVGGFSITDYYVDIVGGAKDRRDEKKTEIERCLADNDEAIEKQGRRKVFAWCSCMWNKWPDNSSLDTISQFEQTAAGQAADQACSKKVGWR